MDESRLNDWRPLFQRALEIIDEAQKAAGQTLVWTFGGGTALMLRYAHRYSHDVDIFVPDPQWLGYLSPRLNLAAERLCDQFVEASTFLKLSFAEGEIDFVATGWLTEHPWRIEPHFGRPIRVEVAAEIIGKKLHYRGAEFTARDLFDLATVLDLEPDALRQIRPMIRDKSSAILERMIRNREVVQLEYEALERFHGERSFERCLTILREHVL